MVPFLFAYAPLPPSITHLFISCPIQVRTLIPKVERLIHNNGMESELLVLHGTVAINYQGRQYNIPVEVYVSEPYPEVRRKRSGREERKQGRKEDDFCRLQYL